MRENKYRMWDKKNQNMIYPASKIYINMFGKVVYERTDSGEIDEAIEGTYELMQFTGLLDKNCEDIWESDKVANKNYEGVVVFDDGCFCLKIKKQLKKDMGPCCWAFNINQTVPLYKFTDLEGIGNIYQHPELLESKDEV